MYASTSGTIGCSATPTPISDGASYCMHVVGKWPYYASKVESELRATEYANKHGLEVIFMRPSVMLGPGDVRFRSTHTLVCMVLIAVSKLLSYLSSMEKFLLFLLVATALWISEMPLKV